MCAKATQLKEAQNPLILRCHRLMDAFAKSDDERDFYIDRQEGFVIYVDLDKTQEELTTLEEHIQKNLDRYCLIPKMTFYETKKIMEGFVNEKVYDIDTKEKLLDIIQSKEARENFLEFIFDHHSEFEKWQQYYQERSRIRIIEWLRQNNFHFVFEEDLDLPRPVIEKVKKQLFETKVDKDILNARKELVNRAKVYYSNEALNPKPKRGRPPKQVAKTDIPLQAAIDIYTTVSSQVRPFLYTPDHASSMAATFSSKFDSEDAFLSTRKATSTGSLEIDVESFNQKLASLRNLTSKWEDDKAQANTPAPRSPKAAFLAAMTLDEDEEDEEEFDDEDEDEEITFKPLKKAPLPPARSVKPEKHAASKFSPKPASKKPIQTKPANAKSVNNQPANNKPRRIQPLKRRIVDTKTLSNKTPPKKAPAAAKTPPNKQPLKRHVKPLVKKKTAPIKAKPKAMTVSKKPAKLRLRRK